MSSGDGLEENKEGVDDKKAIIHVKRWDVCMYVKQSTIKAGCYE